MLNNGDVNSLQYIFEQEPTKTAKNITQIYYWLNCTHSFRIIGSTLFIKLIRGYTSSIVCEINFGIIFLTPIWNAPPRKYSQ